MWTLDSHEVCGLRIGLEIGRDRSVQRGAALQSRDGTEMDGSGCYGLIESLVQGISKFIRMVVVCYL